MFFILTYYPDPYNKFDNHNTTEKTKIIMAKRTRSAKKNGAIPLKICCKGTSGNIDFIINTLRPIGGVIKLISTTMTSTIPNQIRSKPKASTTGTNMGTVKKIMAKPSIMVPSNI